MQAYMGIEAEPGFRTNLYNLLRTRNMETFLTIGVHDVVCRSPSFADMKEFRKIVDSILFLTEKGKALVENTTTYLILDQIGRKSDKKPSAFCFVRSGKLPSRDMFERMVNALYKINSVLAISVVIGTFDLICEVDTENLVELRSTVNKILSTPGVSARATTVCMVLEPGKDKETPASDSRATI